MNVSNVISMRVDMGSTLIPLRTCAIHLCHLCFLCKKTHRNGHSTQMTPFFLWILPLFYTDDTVSHTDISLNPCYLIRNTQITQIYSCVVRRKDKIMKNKDNHTPEPCMACNAVNERIDALVQCPSQEMIQITFNDMRQMTFDEITTQLMVTQAALHNLKLAIERA